jgi:hypothetical protein
MQIKLAEALLRRKELNDKVAQLKTINVQGLWEVKASRKNVTENIDDVIVKVPKITMSQVASAYDWYAKQLRLIDAAIQQANWTTEIQVGDDVLKDFVEPVV